MLALLALTGCARCGAPKGPVDAGVHVKHSSDLRTAFFNVFPEYRGAHILEGRATLERELESELSPAELAEVAKKLGYTAPPDGGATFEKDRFRLEQRAPAKVAVWLPVDDEVVMKVFNAPLALSTMELGLYLPRVPVRSETFVVEIHYIALTQPRAGVLARQVTQLLLGNGQWELVKTDGWTPQQADGGPSGTRVLLQDVPSVLPEAALERSGEHWIAGEPEERAQLSIGTVGEKLLGLVDGKRTVAELCDESTKGIDLPRDEAVMHTLKLIDVLVQKRVLQLDMPDTFVVELREKSTGGVVSVRRDKQRVHTSFTLPTDRVLPATQP